MGQQLSAVHLDSDDETTITSETIMSGAGKDDITFFFPIKTSSDLTESINDQQIARSQMECIKQIRDYLSLLTKPVHWENLNNKVNEILTSKVLLSIDEQKEKVNNEIDQRLAYKQQLQTALTNKFKEDTFLDVSIFALAFSESTTTGDNQQEQKEKYRSEQLSYFAIQSLISILLILIKSAEKNDPIIIQQILTLTGQLCEQLPVNCLSSKNKFLFKSLQPLISYMHELSITSDAIIGKQATKILLGFAIAKGSFKDILALLNKLIFNTSDVYHVQGLVAQLNNSLAETISEWEKQKEQMNSEDKDDHTTAKELTELPSLNYLKSLTAFPNTQLITLDDNLFTGQFISSIVLSYIDIENVVNSPLKQLNFSSISCEFNAETLNDLFHIIDQLSSLQSNKTILHILTVCLRLFTTHLQILFEHQNDQSTYTGDADLKKWFDLLLELSSKQNVEDISLGEAASKALINVINIQLPSFNDKLASIHQYIIDDKHPILIKQLFMELNKDETLLHWIDIVSDDNTKSTALNILYWFIDLYFQTKENQLSTMLESFQKLLFYRFLDARMKENATNSLSSLITDYLLYVFKKGLDQSSTENDLFNSILIGLCSMTPTDQVPLDEAIQPIFIHVLPLLAQYYLHNLDNQLICCLLGRISHALIIGSPQNALEIKHLNKLKLPIFAGGCITDTSDYLLKSNLAAYSQFQWTNNREDEKDFLMSVYNNIDEGARLIFKLKTSIKTRQPLLQKSIEEQANDACAAVFAVYIKLYRRINLAKSELLRTDEHKPHAQLLSIYEYANRIQTLFSTIKAQGGDCHELHKQIKIKALFLLTSIKESDLIAVVKEDPPSHMIDHQPKRAFQYQRQHSRWSKARHVLKLLRNLFQVCIRFKRLMLETKQSMKQKYDHDSLLNRTIDQFIYGDFYKTSTSLTMEERQVEIDELEQCLRRQHERALIRLLTYRFLRIFVDNLKTNDQCRKTLSICLPYIRKNDLEWSYFDHISAANNQLREEISNTYYSIITLVLSFTAQSNHFAENIFYLLNLSYESIDLCHLYQHQIIEKLFLSLVNVVQTPECTRLMGLKLTAFNWFRLFLLKLCENIELEKLRNTSNQMLLQQEKFVFRTLIFNELKEDFSNASEEQKSNSLKDVSISWFLQDDESRMDLYINQYLVLLLRCMHFYKHVLSVCATVEFLEKFLYIYEHNQSSITRLLAIKLLRHLIPCISNDADGLSRNLIETFLGNSLHSIGDTDTAHELVAELIYMYRTIMSTDSSWQVMAIEFVSNSIQSYLNFASMERNDSKEMGKLLAALTIMGGYIEPYRLGSMIKCEMNDKINDESSLALIIDINETETPYLIQFLQSNKTESVALDKLQLQTDVLPPTLSSTFDSMLDTLGSFIQMDTSNNESLLLLQLKRRSMAVLYHMLNKKKLIEIFMETPYASVIAKLCVSNSLEKTRQQPVDLRAFSKEHLQQYCLSLDRCERLKQVLDEEGKEITDQSVSINDQDHSIYTIGNVDDINANQVEIDAALVCNGWRPYASEGEIGYFRQGRIGNDDISIVSVPRSSSDEHATEECGVKHRFRGRITPNSENTTVSFPTFIIDNLQLTEGNWYYCVRLPVGGVVQIGWATNGFTPGSSSGVGDDAYSWSYDGSRAVLFHEQGYYGQFDGIDWKENDVCGCGIEIDGKNTRIKYWLNGKLLGTAFEHDSYMPQTTMKCNLLRNGPTTTYYPAVTLQWSGDPPRCCELVLSPEDMQDCPLPNTYKPLLLPKSIHGDHSLVDYPFSAYLVGGDQQALLPTTRTESTINALRDFINEHHLETTFTLSNHHLILPENSDGFLLSVENREGASLTISFDIQISSPEDKQDIRLFTFDSTEITWEKPDGKLRCVILFLSKKRQIKVYINNKCRLFSDAFSYETIKKLTMHILPGIAAEMKNLAIWKYALSEQQIRRLFQSGLFYVANDYKQLQDYRKQVNTITFSKDQQQFADDILVPFDEPFTESIWEGKKKQANTDESKYFKSHHQADYSTVDLFGNKTYLVLNKSNNEWSKYTLVLHLCIPQWPATNEKLTMITLNPRSTIFIASNGKLCLESDGLSYESRSSVLLNEYFRLFISVQQESVQICLNNLLEIDLKITDDRLKLESNRMELFKEIDLSKNSTSETTLRVSCKSITYLNRSISLNELQSPSLMCPSFSVVGLSLMAMGYKKSWIQSVIEHNKTMNISAIHTILQDQKAQFIQTDLENTRTRCMNILSKLHPAMNADVLKDVMGSSKLDSNEQITNIAERAFIYFESSKLSEKTLDSEGQLDAASWFSQSARDLDIHDDINEWIRSKQSSTEAEDNVYQLHDLSQSDQRKTIAKKTRESIQYSHKNIPSKQFLASRIASEHGLTTIYARSTILNIMEVWSYDRTTLFPLEKFGDYRFLITLLKLLDCTERNTNEKIDRVHLLIYSLLKTELKQLLEHIDSVHLSTEAPLLYHLQKDLIIQSIECLFQPSLFDQNSIEHQFTFDFVIKTLHLFLKLITDKSIVKQHQRDLIIPLLFPTTLINLIFNLFLLVPTHQSKIFIIHLFTTLIQTSETIKLSDRIQQFFGHLLIEFSSKITSISTSSKKKLEIALADFVFVLRKQSTTENNPMQKLQSKLPENIQRLFSTIDVIVAWTDQTKQTALPEVFLTQSKDLVGTNCKLTQDDFDKSRKSFTTIADQDLINFMNNNALLVDSFSILVESLPKESQPDSTFYKKYLLLSNIPADCVQIRAIFIYLLNKFVEKSLPIVDFSLPQGQSLLTDHVRTIKSYLLFSTKFQLFNDSLERTEGAYMSDYPSVHFDTVKASTEAEKSENTMFYQAYQQLHTNAHIIFRRPNEQLWQAQYIGMHSTDSGGPYRDSITRICWDLCSTRLSLFILCPNGRTNSGLNRDCWIPNVFPPNKSIPNKYKKQYRFVGQLMGMAVRKKHYLDLKFASLLWKQILREEITSEDIEAMDMQSFTGINEMEKNNEQIKSMNGDNDMESLFSSIMSELRFDVVSSSGQTYELIPGGSEIPITASNFKHYCSLYRKYRLDEFTRQIDLIREGLYSIIPCYYLSLFTANELEVAVCGKGRIDIEILKRNTYYSGEYSQDSPAIELFWTVLNEMFTDEQKKLFLIFVWGRSTLPTRDEDFQSKFTIAQFYVYGDEPVDRTLPRSHTCFFTIDLPAYSTSEIMYERLNYAISSCSSIDGDGMINDAPDAEEFNADDNLDE